MSDRARGKKKRSSVPVLGLGTYGKATIAAPVLSHTGDSTQSMTTNTVATVNGGQTVSPPAEEIPSSSGVASPAADRASGVGTSTGSRETGLVVKERASNVAFLHSKINPDEPATAFTEDDINVSADLRVINDVQAVRADPGPSAHEGVSSAMPEVALIIRPTSLLDAVAPDQFDDVAAPIALSLADSIPGLYPVLDLVNEYGNDSLVDKIVIAQESFGRFVNDICPNAYQAMTRVDFQALDDVSIKPLGLYGSRSEITRFLQDKGLIGEKTAALMQDGSDSMAPLNALKPGLYLVRDMEGDMVYVIFWPQDTTWDDNAILSVKRNRETFMRYLTKMTDQIVALISDEHADRLLLGNQRSDQDDDTDDTIDRLFSCEVVKTEEAEENAVAVPGFEIHGLDIGGTLTDKNGTSDQAALAPHLIPGETALGFMTVAYIPSETKSERQTIWYSDVELREFINCGSFQIDDSIQEEGLNLLVQHGLGEFVKDELFRMKEHRATSEFAHNTREQEEIRALQGALTSEGPSFRDALFADFVNVILRTFRVFSSDDFRVVRTYAMEAENGLTSEQHPYAKRISFGPYIRSLFADPNLSVVQTKDFQMRKERLLKAWSDREIRHSTTTSAQQAGSMVEGRPKKARTFSTWLKSTLSFSSTVSTDNSRTVYPSDITDAEFLSMAKDSLTQDPERAIEAREVLNVALTRLSEYARKLVEQAAHKLETLQCGYHQEQLASHRKSSTKQAHDTTRIAFVQSISQTFRRDQEDYVQLIDIQSTNPPSRYPNSGRFCLEICTRRKTAEALRHAIRVLSLTQEDKHDIQLDTSHIPTPQLAAVHQFDLPVHVVILHIQLLPENRCLLITGDKERGDAKVYLEKLTDLAGVVQRPEAWKKYLHAEKIGRHLLFAFDETKQRLVVCSAEKLQLYVFVYEEASKQLHGFGNAIDLRGWYDGQSELSHILFRSGANEELIIVDVRRVRVLSFVTQQIRPASVTLPLEPHSIHSTPDASCMLVIEASHTGLSARVYHLASLGSSAGILVRLPGSASHSLVISSFVQPSHCYIAALDVATWSIRSALLLISHRSTEFTFTSTDRRASRRAQVEITRHNSLVNCHQDVWARFPVVPAVSRQIYKCSSRAPRAITFVSELEASVFQRHFSSLIAAFETGTQKPTNNQLADIAVTGISYSRLLEQVPPHMSSFKAGEWLVEMLCLIPVHIAVARDNCFVPLKDGVMSPDFDNSLLGATVEGVTDRLSFGWYESIFGSYMATRPVKVVSSMGEQSVGKSFALNHLVDTSFAGSAMRTTEGVWMSVTPTEDMLIVALDFEGVHSIERSAQEDSLLVLFNTALSNLVIFRNNFALSRNITGLFQSFQSSAVILDPQANSSLFQSRLLIIIKDVIDADAEEIMKEFSLKFQQIVRAEKDLNFITRLHRGKLHIIPWPVIESRQFYKLFMSVKRLLDQQPVTHQQAGIFLQTMKTLMAKLKTNNWGSLDQNLASHRAHVLRAVLPITLEFGATEIEPMYEPLKDIDSGKSLPTDDTLTRLPSLTETEDDNKSRLREIQASWTHFCDRAHMDPRAWTNGLSAYLDSLGDARVDHVRHWLEVNTSRFKTDSAIFQGLWRDFGTLSATLKTSLQLCGLQCINCQLLCLEPRHHEAPHDCHTSHCCEHTCSFDQEHVSSLMLCGLPAGHVGDHICDISRHRCGQPCRLRGKRGCLEHCSKIFGHTDTNHACPAPEHECGMPCKLFNIRLHNGGSFSCQEVCRRPSESPHDDHTCNQQSCPLQCQLCRRLCSDGDHLHALRPGLAVHLCGQEHVCQAVCQSEGICRIETTPQAVEVTFSGRHDRFRYTKYTQESQRLPCIIPIPPGGTQHEGRHRHTIDGNDFHFCQTRCENCGYFCNLPLGHPQEHSTSHGSMSRTRWVVQGDDDAAIDINGHKFGSNDDGAPLLCSMFCQDVGRHAHIDYCRAVDEEVCAGPELQHINQRTEPHPERTKDWLTHSLFWRRTGFKDPYSREQREEFSKCDALCADLEHQTGPDRAAQPSKCTLPILHEPLQLLQALPGGTGYISRDGHHFACVNPALLQQSFHILFVIDRSSSMKNTDHLPLDNTPVTARITEHHNNRLGAVYSALHSFWSARNAGFRGLEARLDSYTVLLFDRNVLPIIVDDYTSSPEEMLEAVLAHGTGLGTKYTNALNAVQLHMESHWNVDKAPVVIFLSDGEGSNPDNSMTALCDGAVRLGWPLSFHAVAFGPYNELLRRMTQIALDASSRVPPNPARPVIDSSYNEAADTIRLAETFLGIAESLSKPRGALIWV